MRQDNSEYKYTFRNRQNEVQQLKDKKFSKVKLIKKFL